MKNILLAVFCILWFLDTAFTMLFVHHMGIDTERNPVLHYVLTHFGNTGFVAAKTVVLLPLVPLHKHMPVWVYAGLALIMVPVAVSGGHMAFWPV